MDFRLPPLGEGIDSAVVVNVLVQPGDRLSSGQTVITVETDKAAVEVPIDRAGVVEAVEVRPGDKLPVGGVILSLQSDGSSPRSSSSAGSSVQAAGKPAEPSSPASAPPGRSPAAGASPATSLTLAPSPAPPPAPAADAPASPSRIPFKLPALGEGIDSATVVNVLVLPGESVTAGQNVIAVETDKAAVEIPVDTSGTIQEVLVKPGDKVPVGAVLLTLEGHRRKPGEGRGGAVASSPGPVTASRASVKNGPPRATSPLQTEPAAPTAGAAVISEAGEPKRLIVPAGPATRRLARELGVSLADVHGSARGGRVTIEDVKNYVKARLTQARPGDAPPASGRIVDAFALPPLPDFARYGPVEKKPVTNIRRKIAENLTIAWRTMPMVTQHDLADITDLEAGRKRIVDAIGPGKPKITMTVLAVKAVVAALKDFPHFNASYDMNNGELVVKKYFHIGIAVDTDRGLVVPVIRDADKKSIRDIAAEIAELAEKARTGKLAIEEMRGGSFTITNLGGIGGTAFTPIVNYPEVAILGLSRSSLQPVVKDGQVVPRLMLPLSLTYDHRVIDGADGARFVTKLVQLFSDPIRLLMET